MSTLEHRIRSILLLQPHGGAYAALVTFFREQDILGKAVEHAGAWSAEMHIPVSRSGPILVTATWDSPAAYEAWRTHPIRATFTPGLEPLIEPGDPPPITSGVYEIALAANRRSPSP